MSTIFHNMLYRTIYILSLLILEVWNCVDGGNGCATCVRPWQCGVCMLNYNYYGGACYKCLTPNCISCSTDRTICYGCKSGTGLNNTDGTCVPCYGSGCSVCSTDYRICTLCRSDINYNGGVVILNSTYHTCITCSIPFCQDCMIDYQICRACILGYYLNSTGGCHLSSVNVTSCWRYSDNVTCQYCIPGYGLNITTGLCDSCAPECISCYSGNWRYCYDCIAGFGVDYTIAQRSCHPCNLTCVNCLSSNYLLCTACNPTGFYLLNLRCYHCMTNCDNCTNSSVCLSCAVGSFASVSGDCPVCPDECATCVWNATFSRIGCTSCPSGLALITIVMPTRCPDPVCGDSLTIIRPCDNALGVPYDGCDDTCHVMPDFNCTVDILSESTLCSFTGSILMQVGSFKRVRLTNKAIIKVSVFPPLNVFQISSEAQNNALFSASMENADVVSLSFDSNTCELEIVLEIAGQITTETPIIITFTPSVNIRPEYFASNNQTLTLVIDYDSEQIFFISNTQKTIANIVLYLSYAVCVLSWFSCIGGLFLRHLAGIQAMLVVQFSWLIILWLKVPLTLSLLRVWPLKYSTGFAYDFDNAETNSSNQSESAPFFTQFKLNSSHFHCNYNVALGLFILTVIAVCVTYARMQKFVRDNKLDRIDKVYKHEDATIKENGGKLEDQYELAEQSLLTISMLSFVPYEFASALFILKGDLSSVPGFSMIVISGIALVIAFVRFYCNPRPCDYFGSSFNRKPLALKHCFVHIVCLTIAIALLATDSPFTFLPIIPLGLQLIYTLGCRPYKETSDNIRSVFNLLVMCAFTGFGVFAQKCTEEKFNSLIADIILLGLFACLFAVVIVGFIFIVYYYWLGKRILEGNRIDLENEDRYKHIVMQQMGEFDPNERMAELELNISFKPLMGPGDTMRNLTHELQSNASDKSSEQGMMKEEMKHHLSLEPLKVENITENQNGHNKSFMNAMMRADKLRINDNLEPQQLVIGELIPCKTMKVGLKTPKDQKKYAEVALTTIKEEIKFIECQAAVLSVEKQMKKPADAGVGKNLEAYDNIKIQQ